MTTHQPRALSPVAVLMHVHHLLGRAQAEATHRARTTGDLAAVDLAFALTCLHGQVLDLLPEPARHVLSHVPQASGVDPVVLARQAEEATRALPSQELPPGAITLVVRLIDTVRNFS
ncbi:hypothetical protein [Ornithinimicrobium sp. LYQ103]|uniref:hypothetical protein n=1 Tax=Ornithinimicrobium sp. LYQ103 TaxID=3378796 RepID=UPI00385452FB